MKKIKFFLIISLLINIIFIFVYYLLVIPGKKTPNNTPINVIHNLNNNKKIDIKESDGKGVVEYIDDDVTISIHWNNSTKNILYKYNKNNIYSYLMDNDADGFADIGVLRTSSKRVKFPNPEPTS